MGWFCQPQKSAKGRNEVQILRDWRCQGVTGPRNQWRNRRGRAPIRLPAGRRPSSPMPAHAIILANSEVRDEVLAAGAAMLRDGAAALDVAEHIARAVEDDPDEHSVGYGGYPNILGAVELDASIIDGATRRVGAVAALTGFAHPVTVARAVMERLPHLLLVGEGAARFAREIGAEQRDLLSPEARERWLARLHELGADAPAAPPPAAAHPAGLIDLVRRALSQADGHDTMNVIVRDAAGNLASAVTTSGVPWKHPGRVGDSPVIGAGNYADNRHGAATCLGWGELAIRTGAARAAVALLEAGHAPADAGARVTRDLQSLCTGDQSVRLLMMDAHGTPIGFATQAGFSYKVQRATDPAPATLPNLVPEDETDPAPALLHARRPGR